MVDEQSPVTGLVSEARPTSQTDDAACRDRSTRVDAREAFDELTETIWRLRQPDGCPWDREQTHASIARNMVEEAYEALDCIEQGDDRHLAEELGDVLMQVMLHAQIASDEHAFTIEDVIRELNAKLIRRHPHVFGDVDAKTDAEAVLDIWDQVKRDERAARSDETPDAAPEGLLDSIPAAFPALMQAQKVSKRAAKAGFEWDTVADIWNKVAEERAEFEAEPAGSEERALEFGDMLFALVNVARREGIDAEAALRASTAKFRERWRAMEQAARERGVALEDLSTAELNVMWDAAKR